MANVIVVFPKLEDAKGIRSLLIRNGYEVRAVCTTGAQAISQMEECDSGIILCGYKFPDMTYWELHEVMSEEFDMILMASSNRIAEGNTKGILCLEMPIKVHDLMDTMAMLERKFSKRKKQERPRPRSEKEQAIILQAKKRLMERNHLSEEEAYRYIQKTSMDSGTNMVETAQMILTVMI